MYLLRPLHATVIADIISTAAIESIDTKIQTARALANKQRVLAVD